MEDETKHPERRLRLVIAVPSGRWSVETIKATVAAATAANGGALSSPRWHASLAFAVWYYAQFLTAASGHAPETMPSDFLSPPPVKNMAGIPLEIIYDAPFDDLVLIVDLNL